MVPHNNPQQSQADVAEFLRRVAERRAAQQRAAAPPAYADPAYGAVQPGFDPSEPAEIEILDEEIEGRDEMMARRMHERFDHHLGKLSDQESFHVQDSRLDDEEQGPPPEPPTPLAELLANPQSFRNGIIMSEILNRPKGFD